MPASFLEFLRLCCSFVNTSMRNLVLVSQSAQRHQDHYTRMDQWSKTGPKDMGYISKYIILLGFKTLHMDRYSA